MDDGKLYDGHLFFDTQMLFSFIKMSNGLLGDETNIIVEVRGRTIFMMNGHWVLRCSAPHGHHPFNLI